MPIVKIYGIPADIGGDPERRKTILGLLLNGVRMCVATPAELEITQEQVTVLFPTDLFETGLGEEIIVEVIGLFKKPKRTPAVRRQVAELVADIVRLHLAPELPQLQMIEVLVHSFSQDTDGYHQIHIKHR